MKINALTFKEFMRNNSFIDKKYNRKYKNIIETLIEENISSAVNLIKANNIEYKLDSEKSAKEYLNHYITCIGNILFSFNNLLLNLTINYCHDNACFYPESEQLNYKKNIKILKTNRKFFSLPDNFVLKNDCIQEFNDKNYLKKLSFDENDEIINTEFFELNKKRINKNFYKKNFLPYLEIKESKEKKQQYNDNISKLNKECKEKFLPFFGWDKIYDAGNGSDNSITKMLNFFVKKKVIPCFILNHLELYEALFRHQVAHGWTDFFMHLLSSSNSFYVYKKNDNYEFGRAKITNLKNIELSEETLKDSFNEQQLKKIMSNFNIGLEKENYIINSYNGNYLYNAYTNNSQIRKHLKQISYIARANNINKLKIVQDNLAIPNGVFNNYKSTKKAELCFNFHLDVNSKDIKNLLVFNKQDKVIKEDFLHDDFKSYCIDDRIKEKVLKTFVFFSENEVEFDIVKLFTHKKIFSLNSLLELIYLFLFIYINQTKQKK